jgi:hypothetical protein
MSEFNQEQYATGEAVACGSTLTKEYDPSFQRWRRKRGPERIFFDDGFETSPLMWTEIGGAGSGTAIAADTTKVATGTKALKCNTKTSGQAANDAVIAERKDTMAGNGLVHFRVRWTVEDLSKNKYVIFTVIYYDHANAYTASIQYDVVNHKWQYLDSGNSWQDIALTTDAYYAAGVFHWFEMEVDFVNMKLVRFMATGYAMSIGTDLYAPVDASTYKYVSYRLETTTQSTSTATSYFDDAKAEETAD